VGKKDKKQEKNGLKTPLSAVEAFETVISESGKQQNLNAREGGNEKGTSGRKKKQTSNAGELSQHPEERGAQREEDSEGLA